MRMWTTWPRLKLDAWGDPTFKVFLWSPHNTCSERQVLTLRHMSMHACGTHSERKKLGRRGVGEGQEETWPSPSLYSDETGDRRTTEVTWYHMPVTQRLLDRGQRIAITLSPSWFKKWVSNQPGTHSETLSLQTNTKTERRNKLWKVVKHFDMEGPTFVYIGRDQIWSDPDCNIEHKRNVFPSGHYYTKQG